VDEEALMEEERGGDRVEEVTLSLSLSFFLSSLSLSLSSPCYPQVFQVCTSPIVTDEDGAGDDGARYIYMYISLSLFSLSLYLSLFSLSLSPSLFR